MVLVVRPLSGVSGVEVKLHFLQNQKFGFLGSCFSVGWLMKPPKVIFGAPVGGSWTTKIPEKNDILCTKTWEFLRKWQDLSKNMGIP